MRPVRQKTSAVEPVHGGIRIVSRPFRIRGVEATITSVLDRSEHVRRTGFGDHPPATDDWEVLDVLSQLPLGKPIPVTTLGQRHQRFVPRLPSWAVEKADRLLVKRVARPSLRPVLAEVNARSLRLGMVKANRFAGCCARMVVVDSEPHDECDLIEAAVYGIGVSVRESGEPRILVTPAPVPPPPSVAGWRFIEQVYAQFFCAQYRIESEGSAVRPY